MIQKANNENLEFKELVKKTFMLFIVLGARRKQSLFTISFDNIVVKDKKVILLPNKTLNEAFKTKLLEPLVYHQYVNTKKNYL